MTIYSSEARIEIAKGPVTLTDSFSCPKASAEWKLIAVPFEEEEVSSYFVPGFRLDTWYSKDSG